MLFRSRTEAVEGGQEAAWCHFKNGSIVVVAIVGEIALRRAVEVPVSGLHERRKRIATVVSVEIDQSGEAFLGRRGDRYRDTKHKEETDHKEKSALGLHWALSERISWSHPRCPR